MADQQGNSGEELSAWARRMQERWVGEAKSFVARVLRAPRGRQVTEDRRRRTMPCQLFLTMGWNSVPMFPSGGVDCFSFFQRGGVFQHLGNACCSIWCVDRK